MRLEHLKKQYKKGRARDPSKIEVPPWYELQSYLRVRQVSARRSGPEGVLDIRVFETFCRQFLSIVVGIGKWKDGHTKKMVSEIATVSDEAFVLFCLENNWEKWMSIAQKR